MTLWRCRCGRAVRAAEAPMCHGMPMAAVAQEVAEQPKRKPCCLGKRRPL